MLPFDHRLLKLVGFLARQSAWLSANEMSEQFRLDGKTVSIRTIYRWLGYLRKRAFVYYPYPRANLLALQEVIVRIHGLRNPAILRIMPFGASFKVEIDLPEGAPVVSQGYWVPGSSMSEFGAFWQSAVETGLADHVELFESRNSHFIYSPFHHLIREDGVVELREPVDNGFFGSILKRNLERPFEVKLGKAYASSPLLIPLVLEHIWEHFSSRQLWRAIRARGEAQIARFADGQFARYLHRPGAAMQLLQQQWEELLQRFEEVFIQARVNYGWDDLPGLTMLTFRLDLGSVEGIVEAALRLSERTVFTGIHPSAHQRGMCQISCRLPHDQVIPCIKLAKQFHRGHAIPLIALLDGPTTMSLFDRHFCKLDWTLFDSSDLRWRFPIGTYLRELEEIATRRFPKPIFQLEA